MKYVIVNKATRIVENIIELKAKGIYLKKGDQGLMVIGQTLDAENIFLIPEPREVTEVKVPLPFFTDLLFFLFDGWSHPQKSNEEDERGQSLYHS